MFAIRCPSCGKLIKTKRSVLEVQVQCRGCGSVFVGSSEIVPDEVGAGAAPSSSAAGGMPDIRARRYHPRSRSDRVGGGPSLWPLYVVAAGVVAIALVIVGIWYYHSHPTVEVRDAAGGVHPRGRVSRSEIERQQEAEEQARLERQAKTHTLSGRLAEPPPAPETSPPTPPPPIEPSDSNVEVAGIRKVQGATPLSGHLVGWARNRSDHAVRSVKLMLVIVSSNGTRLGAGPVTCRYIPPRGAVRFSVEYAGVTVEQIQDVQAIITDAEVDEDLICWEIDPVYCKRSVRGGTVTINGRAVNRTGRTAWNVKIHCDFFTSEEIYVGSAEANLPGQVRLLDGAGAPFEVSFDASGLGFGSEDVVREFSARVVARK